MVITYRFPFRAPDDGTGAAGSEGGDGKAGAQSQDAGKHTGDATGTNGGQQTSGEKTFTQADIDRIVDDRLKRAKQSWDKEAKDKADADAKKKADAQLPELERKTKELDEATGKLTALQAQIRERDAKDAVSEAAKKAGATDPSPIWKLVKGDLEFNEDGTIKNLDAALKDAKTLAPQLFKATSGKADAGAGAQSKTAKPDFMRAALERS